MKNKWSTTWEMVLDKMDVTWKLEQVGHFEPKSWDRNWTKYAVQWGPKNGQERWIWYFYASSTLPRWLLCALNVEALDLDIGPWLKFQESRTDRWVWGSGVNLPIESWSGKNTDRLWNLKKTDELYDNSSSGGSPLLIIWTTMFSFGERFGMLFSIFGAW